MDWIKDLNLSEKQMEQFDIYYKTLIEYNEKCNLTAITEKEEVYIKHFYDSLCLNKVIDLNNQSILDVGSGAGFPSIPIKIMYPDVKVTILDALNKRINFLNYLCEKLDIEVELVHARAEDYIKNSTKRYDIVTARAVARMNVLSELCIPYVKVGGYFVCMKGKDGNNELQEAKRAINMLGGNVVDKEEYSLVGDQGSRVLIKIEKVKETAKKYPRMYSKIMKNPL